MFIRSPLPWFMRGDLRQRAQHIAAVFAKHGLGWISAQFGLQRPSPASRLPGAIPPPSARQRQAEHLRQALEELGGTFIKLGQAASTRPDLIPQEYADELARLQDAAPPEPLANVLRVIATELHRAPDELFAHFDPVPLASASIGQVHAATLSDGGEVVVKVQRPGVAARIEQDLTILSGMAEWAEGHTSFGHDYPLVDMVDEFAQAVRGELDYRAEAHNADRFRINFADDETLTIPRVYWPYTTDRVLTMERVHGIKISDLRALDEAGVDRHLVAENLCRLILREAFEFGFFHADPHPGNFFVRQDSGIALIDYGMVGHLSPRLQEMLLDLGVALVRADAERLTDSLYMLGVASDPMQRPHLERDVERVLSRYSRGSLQDLSAAPIIREVMAVAFRYHLRLPSEVIMLLRLVVLSEGIGLTLDPQFQLFNFAAPYLRRFWLRRRSPDVMAGQFAQSLANASDLIARLPRQVTHVLSRLEHGSVQVDVNPERINEAIGPLQRMTNRLATAIVLAATIVSLGLMMVAYHPAHWERVALIIVVLGFFGSCLFALLLLWSIFRSGGD